MQLITPVPSIFIINLPLAPLLLHFTLVTSFPLHNSDKFSIAVIQAISCTCTCIWCISLLCMINTIPSFTWWRCKLFTLEIKKLKFFCNEKYWNSHKKSKKNRGVAKKVTFYFLKYQTKVSLSMHYSQSKWKIMVVKLFIQ